MDFESVCLTRKELRRFLEIANGDNTAKKKPYEDALFRKGLVKESIMVFADLDDNTSSIDMRAVTLTSVGQNYFVWYMNQRKRKHKEDLQFWIGIAVAVAGIAVSIISATH